MYRAIICHPAGKDTGQAESYPGEEQVAGESVSRRNSRNTHLGVGQDGQGVGQVVGLGFSQGIGLGVGQGDGQGVGQDSQVVGHRVGQGNQQIRQSRPYTAAFFKRLQEDQSR